MMSVGRGGGGGGVAEKMLDGKGSVRDTIKRNLSTSKAMI